VILEAYVEQYKGVALLTPVLIGLAGNLGSIYASRIGTCLHAETKENYGTVEFTLMAMNIPVQFVFLLIIWAFGLGQLNYTVWFFLTYFTISMICVSCINYYNQYLYIFTYPPIHIYRLGFV
jgi:solute carrier family 41